jgi:hypothetical protein
MPYNGHWRIQEVFIVHRPYCRVAVMVPVSASHPPERRANVIVSPAAPDDITVICPENVVTLLQLPFGPGSRVMAPDGDTVNIVPDPKSKCDPDEKVYAVNFSTPLATVAVNVPTASFVALFESVMLQSP